MTGSRWLFDPTAMDDSLFHPAPAGALVDARAAAADIRDLGDLLVDSYARFPQYAAAGFDVPAFLEAHAQRVEHLNHPTAAQAFLPVFRGLRVALPDNHLSPAIPERAELAADPALHIREYRGPADALDAAAHIAGAIASTAERIRVVDRSDSAIVGSVAVQGDAHERDLARLGYQANDSVTPTSDLLPTSGPAYSFHRQGTTGIIRLPTFDLFSGSVRGSLDRFVGDVAKHRQCENLVVDMRGNAGGSVFPVMEWARALRTPQSSFVQHIDSQSHSGKQNAVTRWNSGVSYQHLFPTEPWAQEAFADAHESRRLWPLSGATPVPDATPPLQMPGTGATDWKGRIYVLVDRRNASSGELAADTLRDWLGATIVGERTAGYVEGLDVLTYQLPATGINVNIPSVSARWADPRIREGAGIPIDVAVADIAAPADALADRLLAMPARSHD